MTDSPSKPRWGGAPSTKCEKCGKTVYNAEKVKMEGQIWHVNCLRCVECNKKLNGGNWGGFVPPENSPYCSVHFKRLVRAAGNSISISGSAGTDKWEKKESSSPSPSSSRWGGAPKTKCFKCDKTVYNAEMIKMDGKVFHGNCLRCVECNKKVTGANWGGMVPPNDDVYCSVHHKRLLQAAGSAVGFSGSAGTDDKKWEKTSDSPTSSPKPASTSKPRWGGAPSTKCEKCGKTVYNAEMSKMEGKIFHIKCLRCVECNKILSGANWGGFGKENEAYCKVHLDRLIAATGSAVGISGGRDAQWKVEGS